MKNRILKTITTIAGLGWLISGCMMDSGSPVWIYAAAAFILCTLWLVLFMIVNRDYILG